MHLHKAGGGSLVFSLFFYWQEEGVGTPQVEERRRLGFVWLLTINY